MPHPNSGRMGRSPNAVPRISRIAWRISVSSPTSASAPVGPAFTGNPIPRPTNSAAISWLPSVDPHETGVEVGGAAAVEVERAAALDLGLGAADLGGGLTLDLDRLALDRHRRLALDRDRLALQRQRPGGLDGHLALARDRDVALGVDLHDLVTGHDDGAAVAVLVELERELLVLGGQL